MGTSTNSALCSLKHKHCINRVFCQTTSKTINFKIPTGVFQTDKQKTQQLLTNLKCKKYFGHKWMGSYCLQLNGLVLFVVFEVIGLFCVCVYVVRALGLRRPVVELTALGDRSLTFFYNVIRFCVAGCFRHDSQWCPLTSAKINFTIQPFGWIYFHEWWCWGL